MKNTAICMGALGLLASIVSGCGSDAGVSGDDGDESVAKIGVALSRVAILRASSGTQSTVGTEGQFGRPHSAGPFGPQSPTPSNLSGSATGRSLGAPGTRSGGAFSGADDPGPASSGAGSPLSNYCNTGCALASACGHLPAAVAGQCATACAGALGKELFSDPDVAGCQDPIIDFLNCVAGSLTCESFDEEGELKIKDLQYLCKPQAEAYRGCTAANESQKGPRAGIQPAPNAGDSPSGSKLIRN